MIEYRPSGEAITPERVYNTPRNVWKRRRKKGRPVSILYTFLGLFTVSVEVFFRRNFGQRWLTTTNFLGGFVILALFTGLQWGVNTFLTSEYYSWLRGFSHGYSKGKYELLFFEPGYPIMLWILAIYLLRGFYHFYMMWWRDRTHTASHSFDDGMSFFEPVARPLMRLINLLAKPFIFLLMLFLPGKERKRIKSAPPLLNNVSVFTDTFIEPVMLLLLAYLIRGAVGIWLAISAIAVLVHAKEKASIRRNKFLDFRDAGVEAEDMKAYHHYVQSGIIQTETLVAQQTKVTVIRKRQINTGVQPQPPTDLNQMIEDLRKNQ